MQGQRYVANRPIYKQPKPEHLPDPPEGYSYVGKGVPNEALLKRKGKLEIYRYAPKEHTCKREVKEKWHYNRYYVGVVPVCHYAIPTDVWALIDYPPELNKKPHEH